MDFKAVEKKWNEIWDKEKTFKFKPNDIENKEYILEMFSNPSGSRLHIGHLFNFTIPGIKSFVSSKASFPAFVSLYICSEKLFSLYVSIYLFSNKSKGNC